MHIPESSPLPAASRKRPASHSPSPSHALSRKHAKKVGWLNGLAPTGRAKAQDYEPDVFNIIIQSCHDYLARVCTKDPLPSPEVQLSWARVTWEDACKDVEEDYQINDRISGLVSTEYLSIAKTDYMTCNRLELMAATLAQQLKMLFDLRYPLHLGSYTRITITAKSAVAIRRYMQG